MYAITKKVPKIHTNWLIFNIQQDPKAPVTQTLREPKRPLRIPTTEGGGRDVEPLRGGESIIGRYASESHLKFFFLKCPSKASFPCSDIHTPRWEEKKTPTNKQVKTWLFKIDHHHNYNLNSSVGYFADFLRTKRLPLHIVHGFVQLLSGPWSSEVHECVAQIKLVPKRFD